MNTSADDCEISTKKIRSSKKIIFPTNSDEISVYPNPTQGNLTVELNVKRGQVVYFELYDVLGKKQDEIKLTAGNLHQLNLMQKQHGIYFYRLVDNNSAILKSGKIIIE